VVQLLQGRRELLALEIVGNSGPGITLYFR
jgi:hypothetical protein